MPSHFRHTTILLALLGLLFAISSAFAQPATTVARAGWRVGGSVTTAARLGDVVYLGGFFRGVAPEANASGNMLGVDLATGVVTAGFGQFGGTVNAVASDGAGGWYVAGNFIDFVSTSVTVRSRLAHLLPGGVLDQNWAPVADLPVRGIAFVAGVGVFVGGDFTLLNGTPRTQVGLLDATTGALLPWNYTIAGGGVAAVRSLVVDGGAVIIGGGFQTVDGLPRTNLAVLSATASGQVGPAMNASNPVERVYASGGGVVYIGGNFVNVGGQVRTRLARFTHAAGTLTLTLDAWAPSADGMVRTIVAAGNTVFVGGEFLNAGGQPRARLVQLDAASGAATSFAQGANAGVSALAVSGDTVFVGGLFDTLAGQTRNSAGALSISTGTLLPWNPSPAGTVNMIAVGGNTVLVGGAITGYGAVPRSNLAAVNLQTGQLLPWNPRVGGTIDDVVVRGGTVYITGGFTDVGGVARNGLAAVDAAQGTVLPWNPDPNGAVNAIALDATSAYIGGAFTTVGGQARSRLARVDLTTGAVDAAFAPAANTNPQDLLLDGAVLYVGGTFTVINGTPAVRVAALNAQTGALVPGFSASADTRVNKLRLANGALYLAGTFTTVNGQPRTNVAKVDAVTGALRPWAPQVALASPLLTGFIREMNDVQVLGNVVMLSGAFDQIDGQPRFGVATVDEATGALTSWAPALGSAPSGGFGGAILSAPDVTVVGGSRIQLADDLLNGLALFVEPGGGNPVPPAGLTAAITGSTIDLKWSAPPLGRAATSYVIEVGSAPGRSDLAAANVGNVKSFSAANVPTGTYYLRVRSVTATGTSLPSPEIGVTVGSAGCAAPPSAPADFKGGVNGSTIDLAWTASPGAISSGYVLQAGTAPGLANIGTLPTSATAFTTSGVPPGVYHLRVLATNACGLSSPTPDVVLNVGGVPQAPSAPLAFTASVSAGTASLTWVAPPLSTVTNYVVEAGTAPGAANLGTVSVTATAFAAGGVPAGTYFLRVRAVNAVGSSVASNEVVLIVP